MSGTRFFFKDEEKSKSIKLCSLHRLFFFTRDRKHTSGFSAGLVFVGSPLSVMTATSWSTETVSPSLTIIFCIVPETGAMTSMVTCQWIHNCIIISGKRQLSNVQFPTLVHTAATTNDNIKHHIPTINASHMRAYSSPKSRRRTVASVSSKAYRTP